MKPKAHRISSGCCVGGALLALIPLMTGCADSPPWGAWSKSPSPAQIAAVMGRRPETFIYFSRYEVYQNERTKEYVYQDGHWWIHSPLPPVTIDPATLKQSPAVIVPLQESPEKAHAKTRAAYPSDWDKAPAVVASVP